MKQIPPVSKHPHSSEVATADYTKRLAEGEQLVAVVTQPTIARREPAEATAPQFQTAVVNSADVAVPNAERPVKAFQGVQFGVGATAEAARFWIEIKASTTAGREIAVELELIVSYDA